MSAHPHRALYAMDARTVARISQLDAEHASAHALADAAARLRVASELMERRAVAVARAEFITWAEIGSWFGITRQAAFERFNDHV